MSFRLEYNQSRKIPYLTEFDGTPRFWYPRVAYIVWIDFSSWTVELRPSQCRENLFFFLSLFLYVCFFLSFILCLFSSSLSFIYPLEFLAFHFVCSYYHFPCSFTPSIFSFSFIFYFLHFSLFSSFLISCHFLLSRLIKVGETSPHFPHMPLVFFTQFSYFLIYFSFPLLHHSTHGSM